MNRLLVLILGCLFIITLGFGPAGLALCMPTLAADLHLTYTQQGVLLSIGLWAFLVALLSAGVADRAGFRGLLVLSAIIQASGWLLMGCATNYAWLCAAALATGIGSALADPLLTPMVCAVYPEQRARISNVLHAGYALGLVFTSMMAMALLAAGANWRGIMQVLGLFCLPCGAAALVVRLPARAHQGHDRLPLRRALRQPLFWLLALAMAVAGGIEMAPTGWLPTLLQQRAGASGHPALAGGASMLLFGALLGAGRLLTAFIERRLGLRRWLLTMALLCGAGFVVAVLPLGAAGAAIGLGAVGFGVACFWPSLLALGGDRFPTGGASMFTGLTVAGGLGAGTAPAVVGWIADHTRGGLTTGLCLMALLPLVLFAVVARMTGAHEATDRDGK